MEFQSITAISAKEIALNSVVLTALIRVVWSAATSALNALRNMRMRKPKSYVIPLGTYHEEFDGFVEFYCLIVRYGTDQYIQHMASDQEKYDGRLQNRVVPVSVIRSGDEPARFALRLPIHNRLGTQFKCFAEVRDPGRVNDLIETLQQCDRVHAIGLSSSQFRNRVYFLLKDFATTDTVDGMANNICFPA